MLPLDGIKVLDATHVIAGRFETGDVCLVITANTFSQSLRLLKALHLTQFNSLAERGSPNSDMERDTVPQALSDVFQTK